MKSTWIWPLMVACNPFSPAPEPLDSTTAPIASTGDTGIDLTGDTGAVEPPFDFSLAPLEAVNNGRFATSLVCASCHSATSSSSAMRDPMGGPVGAYDGWQATMMANASRDPLWRAVLSAEIAATPSQKAEIEATCMKCHAPMRRADTQITGVGSPQAVDLAGDDEAAHLALDGVSCAMCHQIEADGLGTPESLNGGYVVKGIGNIFGPYTNPYTPPMEALGFVPQYGQQIADSLVCATCHTVQTRALGADGQLNGGEVLEQAPYLEWENSRYPSAQGSCVACHMPDRDEAQNVISTVIATAADGTDDPNLSPRSPYNRHVLVGGNTLIPAILRDNADLLGVTAPRQAFDDIIATAREQLQQRTASVLVSPPFVNNGFLTFTATIEPQTGHKFPTGIPVRRVFLRTVVTDATGQTVFASGQFDVAGRLIDETGMPMPFELAGGPVAPHVDLVDSPDDVPIYEAVLADINGQPTYRLMRGAGFYKDNRLLPQGWSPVHPNAAVVGPVGVGSDPDWTTPGDKVDFSVPVDASFAMPLTIDVTLYYQPLSARFAEELFVAGTDETEAFRAMYLRSARAPEQVSRITLQSF